VAGAVAEVGQRRLGSTASASTRRAARTARGDVRQHVAAHDPGRARPGRLCGQHIVVPSTEDISARATLATLTPAPMPIATTAVHTDPPYTAPGPSPSRSSEGHQDVDELSDGPPSRLGTAASTASPTPTRPAMTVAAAATKAVIRDPTRIWLNRYAAAVRTEQVPAGERGRHGTRDR